jgi:hypothetical protein
MASTALAWRAKRAIGAMFFTVFGGVWFALWARFTFAAPMPAYVPVALVTLGLLACVYRVYAVNQPALDAEKTSPAGARQSRLFHIVNAGQWVLILVVGNVLANLGRSDLVVPAAMFIIGAHFLPLARIFSYAPHFITGAALMVIALLCPRLNSWGGLGPLGYFAAGAILWASAVWAVKPRSERTNG